MIPPVKKFHINEICSGDFKQVIIIELILEILWAIQEFFVLLSHCRAFYMKYIFIIDSLLMVLIFKTASKISRKPLKIENLTYS